MKAENKKPVPITRFQLKDGERYTKLFVPTFASRDPELRDLRERSKQQLKALANHPYAVKLKR